VFLFYLINLVCWTDINMTHTKQIHCSENIDTLCYDMIVCLRIIITPPSISTWSPVSVTRLCQNRAISSASSRPRPSVTRAPSCDAYRYWRKPYATSAVTWISYRELFPAHSGVVSIPARFSFLIVYKILHLLDI